MALVLYGSVCTVYGLEIPVKYKFIGPEKAINWMKTQINKKVNAWYCEEDWALHVLGKCI